ncbi:MAG: DegT/DnrJ/EryC1/StrS family aminotransferase [Bdellovibrionales bacterium]|nr:DegT/DnrJ/EryC1/StrS family aminotransferase [Bdellovibrionales bacterium]
MFDLYLSPPHLSGEEQELVADAIRSNWVAPLGPYVDAFERDLGAYVGEGFHALAVSSGTAALHLALRLAGVSAGDRVICPTMTFVGSANPILYLGATPIFVDSEEGGWNLCPQSLKKALSGAKSRGERIKAAIVVDLYGESAQYQEILPILRKEGIFVIEDAAESLGTIDGGRRCGTFGDLGVLSFNGNKIITTSGGGALLSRDKALLDKARFWATQARDPAPHYQHSELGYNYRLSNLLAAVGVAQLRRLEERVTQRRQVFDRYETALRDLPGVRMAGLGDQGGRVNRWLSVIDIDSRRAGVAPMDVLRTLASEKIESRPVWKPMHLQPLFSGCEVHSIAARPYSESAFERGLCLPSGSALTTDQQDRVIRCLGAAIKRAR